MTPAAIAEQFEARVACVPGAELDYIACSDPATLEALPVHAPFEHAVVSTAVWFGAARVRLIDNVRV